MATDLFIRRATKWLDIASAKKSTILCSPNFGYKHLLKRFDPGKISGVDLSSVRLIFNGAEPISLELCNEFLSTLEPFGLKRNTMYPVYGLAEATLAVSFPRPGDPIGSIAVDREQLGMGDRVERVSPDSVNAVHLVSVGEPIPHCEVRIADIDGKKVADDVVGRILIRGQNVTSGYYEDSEATSDAIEDGWLDTGDLGFFHEGELYIAGRAKEIIFVNGQNFYPHDIENVAVQGSGIELGRVAVAGHRSNESGTDDLLVFVHHRGKLDSFVDTETLVTQCINEHTGLEVAHVIPVRQIPKTTSGKIQRRALEQAFAAGEFDDQLEELRAVRAATSSSPDGGPTDEIEDKLTRICREAVPDKEFGRDTNLFELGMSSLVLIQIFGEIDETWPDQLDITDLFDYPTIAELASYLEKQATT